MTYPKYRLSQWVDNSPEALQSTSLPIVYGIQTQRLAGGRWMNVTRGSQPMFFDSPEKASEACDVLRKADAAEHRSLVEA